ncbi:MAG: transglutaminase family protein [Spirulina sp. SIO3F2]|nr:transglutaminase family protein [Spirulina sp. SIO3F2]
MIPDSSGFATSGTVCPLATLYPLATAKLQGIAFSGDNLYTLDSTTGYLLEVGCDHSATQILNSDCWQDFVGATGLALEGQNLWFTRYRDLYCWNLQTPEVRPQRLMTLREEVQGIAIQDSTIYLSCVRQQKILVFSRDNYREITHFYAPGIGAEKLAVRGEELWVCDDLEQTVYCLDRATGEVLFNVLTPFENPTAVAFAGEQLYVAYVQDEPYIRDNPNAYPNHELQYRDRSFIHPLYTAYYPEQKYALSNGYRLEMSYVEELSPLDPFELKDIEWHMALPAETQRQHVRHVEPIGRPFEQREINGQQVAVFKFDHLDANQRHLLGWRAIVDVWGIKYQFTPQDGSQPPELTSDLQTRYLVDNDNLAMDQDIIQRAALDATRGEANLLRKMYNIRNYVYDRLSYGIKPHIDTPDVALARGVGSCGEYLGVLLALARLNGIACRTVGRYKCPPKPLERNLPLEPDFNHVWMEFYLPGYGWLPMESNPDDIQEGGPYPTRFFMGLAWYHAEMGKGIPFEKLYRNGEAIAKEEVALGSLAINHVRFTVLDELKPPTPD